MAKTQTVLPFVVKTVPEDLNMTARAGLALVFEAVTALGVEASVKRHVHVRRRSRGFSDASAVKWFVGLLASGGDCIDDFQVLDADGGLCRLVGERPPKPSTAREYLYGFHDDNLIETARREAEIHKRVAYIPGENGPLVGLGLVMGQLAHRVGVQLGLTKATLDLDATIQESHKREAKWHYKGGRGYQPSVIYWVESDQIVGDEYRDGNVPAGMSNLPLIQLGFSRLPPTITQRYFRGDSACYEDAVLKWLANPKRANGPEGHIGFTISADMSEELRGVCEQVPQASWELLEERTNETVWCSDVEFTPGDWPKNAQPLRYIGLRIKKKQGELFSWGGDTKYLAVVTNRDGKMATLVRWHWEKAGTIELVHDVTKNELGAAVPPCGRFGANAAWYRLSLLTYNVLSAMKSLALPAEFGTARPKRLRHRVFSMAGRIVSHSGRLILRVGERAERIAGLLNARTKLAALVPIFAPT